MTLVVGCLIRISYNFHGLKMSRRATKGDIVVKSNWRKALGGLSVATIQIKL